MHLTLDESAFPMSVDVQIGNLAGIRLEREVDSSNCSNAFPSTLLESTRSQLEDYPRCLAAISPYKNTISQN